MTRVIGPCFGLDARGTLGKSMTYSIRRGVNYVRARVDPANPKSAAQQQIRAAFSDGTSKWRFGYIVADDKEWWNYYAAGTAESGYNRFMRYYLRNNYDNTIHLKVTPQVIPSPQ